MVSLVCFPFDNLKTEVVEKLDNMPIIVVWQRTFEYYFYCIGPALRLNCNLLNIEFVFLEISIVPDME